MEKIYTYKNAIVRITKPNDAQLISIKRATNRFMKKIVEGGNTIGNRNTSGDIYKK